MRTDECLGNVKRREGERQKRTMAGAGRSAGSFDSFDSSDSCESFAPFGLREVCSFPSRAFASVWCERRRLALFASGSEDAILIVVVSAESDEEPFTHLIPWQSPAPAALCFDPSASWLACCSRSTLSLISMSAFVGIADSDDPLAKLDRPVELPLEPGKVPTAAAWWQADARHPVVAVGDQTGQLLFLSLTTLRVVGKSYIVGRVCELAVCTDEDLDSVHLLVRCFLLFIRMIWIFFF